jgi:hypothetical protein
MAEGPEATDAARPAVSSTDWLGAGARLLLEWGGTAREAVITAEGKGRYHVKMDWGGAAIMTRQQLEERRYIPLPPKPKRVSWMKRLFGS